MATRAKTKKKAGAKKAAKKSPATKAGARKKLAPKSPATKAGGKTKKQEQRGGKNPRILLPSG